MVIITHANSYHFGYNTGPNINEAVNFLIPGGIDYVLDNDHCGCPEILKLKINDWLKKTHRPSILNNKEFISENPDDPEIIEKNKIKKNKQILNARKKYNKKRDMQGKKQLDDELLLLYFCFLEEIEHSHRTSKDPKKINELKKYWLAKGISKDHKTLQLGPKKLLPIISNTLKQFNVIIKRPLFNQPEYKETMTFIKKFNRGQ